MKVILKINDLTEFIILKKFKTKEETLNHFLKNNQTYSTELLKFIVFLDPSFFKYIKEPSKKLYNFFLFNTKEDLKKYQTVKSSVERENRNYFEEYLEYWKLSYLSYNQFQQLWKEKIYQYFENFPIDFQYLRHSNKKIYNNLRNSGDSFLYEIVLKYPFNIEYIPKIYSTIELQQLSLNNYLNFEVPLELDSLWMISKKLRLTKINSNLLTNEICLKLLKMNIHYMRSLKIKNIITPKLAKFYVNYYFSDSNNFKLNCTLKRETFNKYFQFNKKENILYISKKIKLWTRRWKYILFFKRSLPWEYSKLWPKIKRI